jgi:hypothetical protein
MSYELAKQLKDAGYPFVRGENYHTMRHGEVELPFPMLRELILKCGDEFGALIKIPSGWRATCAVSSLETEGKYPEEAVARLWLALHGNGDASA